jgi:hypothetical protein
MVYIHESNGHGKTGGGGRGGGGLRVCDSDGRDPEGGGGEVDEAVGLADGVHRLPHVREVPPVPVGEGGVRQQQVHQLPARGAVRRGLGPPIVQLCGGGGGQPKKQ